MDEKALPRPGVQGTLKRLLRGLGVPAVAVRPPVVNLAKLRRPFTVFAVVRPVVIEPFQAQARPPGRLHITPEKSEGERPLSANRDSAASVMFPLWMVRVETSLQHVFSRVVKRDLFLAGPSPGCSVCGGSKRLLACAAAAPAFAGDQALTCDESKGPATALAQIPDGVIGPSGPER